MKISEFKERLDQLQELHGDVEVMVDVSPYSDEFEEAEPHYLNVSGFVEVY